MFRTSPSLFLIGGLCLASTAHANDGDLSPSSSSGSVSVSVYRPPIGGALAASQEGAVGLWSVSGRNSGLMIRLHRASSGDGYEAISVYSREEVGVVAEWGLDHGGRVEPMAEKAGGLNKTTYAVPPGPYPVRTLTIRGI